MAAVHKASAEADAISGFVYSPDLHRRLRYRARYYVRDNFRLDADMDTGKGLTTSLNTAIKLGYYRAKMYRFLVEQGHEPKTWFWETRVKAGLTNKDRSNDIRLLETAYPEFQSYTMGSALTQDEVANASMEEVYDMMCGAGSDYQQNTRTVSNSASQIFTCGEMGPNSNTTSATSSMADNTVENTAFKTDPNEVFGPACIHVGRHFVKRFGVVPTVYWLWKRTLVPETTDLLRLLGGADVDMVNSPLRRDMDRKLAQMDAELSAFVNDPALIDAYESI